MPKGKHVLVAEDNPQEIFIYETAFKRIGISSYTFVNEGAAVIEYLQGKGEWADRDKYPFPRWLLLDIRMPRLDGFGVLKWLYEHQECRVIPTITFADSDRDEDVRRSYQLGTNGYFVKPHGLQSMIEVLSLIDHFWNVARAPLIKPTERCG